MRMRAAISAGFMFAAMLSACDPTPDMPRISRLPAFELRDQDGAVVGPAQLEGEIWIANFIFTSCPDVCPILTTKMADVRRRLVGDRVDVRIVSISVDPATDTPEVLKRYASEHGVDHDDWRFVTGPAEDVKRVVVEGFKQAMQAQPGQAAQPATILHGSHFVLVDRELYIRGYYESDDEGLLRLVRDARILAAESKQEG